MFHAHKMRSKSVSGVGSFIVFEKTFYYIMLYLYIIVYSMLNCFI